MDMTNMTEIIANNSGWIFKDETKHYKNYDLIIPQFNFTVDIL